MTIIEINPKHTWFQLENGVELWVTRKHDHYPIQVHIVENGNLGAVMACARNSMLMNTLRELIQIYGGLIDSK